MDEVLLDVVSLGAGYGEVQVLWDVSLTVSRGRVTTLIGANGAGKTTALRAIVGSISPRSGCVRFGGADVTRLLAHAKVERGLVLVPEGRQLFKTMTVAENLEMGAFSRRAARQYAHHLDRVFTLFPRLAERRRQISGTLSGGEQQMLAIGRGLMSDPELLIIDEMSLGLAPILVHQLFSALKTLKGDGLTIMLVEQNVHLAFALSDHAYVIADGRVFTEGSPQALATRPEIRRAYLGL
jgi:branched-chain amino acid transport system ATP-binding protein